MKYISIFLFCWTTCLSAGEFKIINAETHLVNGVYLLNSQIDYQLSEAALDALNNGVPITFEVKIEVLEQRQWLWNKTIALLRQYYILHYHALAKKYQLSYKNTDIEQSFFSLSAAITALGDIQDLPILDKEILEADKQYQVRLKAVLVIEDLPLPLLPIAYFSPSWLLSSDWYQWTLSEQNEQNEKIE